MGIDLQRKEGSWSHMVWPERSAASSGSHAPFLILCVKCGPRVSALGCLREPWCFIALRNL